MRQPYQILILPFRRIEGVARYIVFLTKGGFWQFVSGGGEDNETVIETAIREMKEETNIDIKSIIRLDTLCSIPVSAFHPGCACFWGDRFVIPEYSFAADIGESFIKISNEHIEFREVSYDEAFNLLKYDSNKTALFELNSKLQLCCCH